MEFLSEFQTSIRLFRSIPGMCGSEFIYHNKVFRIPELIEKLKQDENDLVRNSAASITTPDPLRAPIGPIRP